MIRALVVPIALWMVAVGSPGLLLATGQSPDRGVSVDAGALVGEYCIGCHNDRLTTGGLSLEGVDADDPAAEAAVWERVVRKLQTGSMPPQPRPRPDRETYDHLVAYLEAALDEEAVRTPQPGRTETFRRLNRTEYQNAIRDLLALEIDATALLPREG